VLEYGSPAELAERRGKYWQMFVEKEGLGTDEVRL
jgi:ABC-type multidrug transport system fused ATPase/permease subunit